MPRVSVIMNCFNGERYLKEAIDSVYAQSFKDWEIIFWDNASTDNSSYIARSYDNKMRYFREKSTIPLGAARKKAVQQAKGEWIGFLDSDDLWYPHKLERQLVALENTDHILCYAGIKDIRSDGSTIREIVPKYSSGWHFEKQLLQFDINMVTPLIRRQILVDRNLNFDENITASEEYNLFVRLAAKGTFCTVPEVLGVWRIHSGSLTDRQISKWSEERYYTLEQLKKENPGIEKCYPEAFREAYARGDYYKACYLASVDKGKEARKTMKAISEVNVRYLLLWFSMYIPFVWRLLHLPASKRWLSQVLGIVKSSRS